MGRRLRVQPRAVAAGSRLAGPCHGSRVSRPGRAERGPAGRARRNEAQCAVMGGLERRVGLQGALDDTRPTCSAAVVTPGKPAAAGCMPQSGWQASGDPLPQFRCWSSGITSSGACVAALQGLGLKMGASELIEAQNSVNAALLLWLRFCASKARRVCCGRFFPGESPLFCFPSTPNPSVSLLQRRGRLQHSGPPPSPLPASLLPSVSSRHFLLPE